MVVSYLICKLIWIFLDTTNRRIYNVGIIANSMAYFRSNFKWMRGSCYIYFNAYTIVQLKTNCQPMIHNSKKFVKNSSCCSRNWHKPKWCWIIYWHRQGNAFTIFVIYKASFVGKNRNGLKVLTMIVKRRNTTPVNENDSGIIEKVFSRNARGTIHAVKYLLDDQTTFYEK